MLRSLTTTSCLSVLVILSYAIISLNQARIEIPLLIKELDAVNHGNMDSDDAVGARKAATGALHSFGLNLFCSCGFIAIHFINFRSNYELYAALLLWNIPSLLTAMRKEIEASGFASKQHRMFAIVFDCFTKCAFIPRYFILSVLSFLVCMCYCLFLISLS